ncbi:MAG: mannitol dehydrogenase family protein [Rhodospirillales bacterium]|nr:mannitol dehydrogenase family protein [Rhodospirillales bacterium]
MTAPRLSAGTLARAAPGVRRPQYDRTKLRPRIVHLGLGAFFRAHGALYTDDVLGARGGDWGIIGVSLRHPDQRDRLAPQDGLYTTLQQSPAGIEARVVGSLLGVLVASEDPAAVVARLASPQTALVSLTVTEKGYCHQPATGRLDADHPDIRHDLAHPDAPRSAIGFLVAGLARRRADGVAPFTVLCCDNLPRNGALLAGLVQDFAACRDGGLAEWIAGHVAFPATMVDRIVPATTPADIAAAAQATGLHDAAPVVHEPFAQWVIGETFGPLGRPAWDVAGAQFVADVAPFEHAKLRLLNAAHSALAWLGLLAGHASVAQAIADPDLDRFTASLWREITAVLPPPPGMVLGDYTAALRTRFANPAIHHRLAQIAMDSSQKLPQRLLSTIGERLRQDLPIPCLALAVAGWIGHLGGADETGRPIALSDPLADALRRAAAGGAPREIVGRVLALTAVFAPALAGDARFVGAVTGAFGRLRRDGVHAAARAAAG